MGTSTDFWEALLDIECRSERDVEVRLIVPFLQALGWPLSEIHSGVPVNFQIGRNRGRKPEADIVLAEESSTGIPPTYGWVVIEAKKPTESVEASRDQAFTYSYGLRAVLYLVTNSIEFELWQTGRYEPCKLVLKGDRSALLEFRSEWERLLSRQSLMHYLKENTPLEFTTNSYDFTEHARNLYEQSPSLTLLPRTIETVGANGERTYLKIGSSPETSFKLDNGARYYFTGWGGRGKSSILHLLIRETLREYHSQRRLPILISAKRIRTNLLDAISTQLSRTVPPLGNVGILKEWLRQTTILLAIDDWEKISEAVRDACMSDIDYLRTVPCSILIASRSYIPSPSGFSPLEIQPFSEEEQVQFVAHHLDLRKRGAAFYYLDQAPEGLRELLAEPVILSQWVDLFIAHDWKGFTPPSNVPKLLDAIIETLVTNERSRSTLLADEFNAVCAQVSRNSPFLRSHINGALHDTGSQLSVDTIIEELVGIQIWTRTITGSYDFSHDIWKYHFSSKFHFNQVNCLADITSWIDSAEVDARGFYALFAAGLVQESSLQDDLLDWLLWQDLDLYLHALRGRASTLPASALSSFGLHTENFCMEQVLHGYEDFVNRCIPGMKEFIDPWMFYPGSRDEELKISGRVSPNSGRFVLGILGQEKLRVNIGDRFVRLD